MNIYRILLFISFIVFVSACSTPGNLKTDLGQLDLEFSEPKIESELIIEFSIMPGTASASTEMFVSGVFIKGSGSVDADSIAVNMAELVFSKLFNSVYINRDDSIGLTRPFYKLKIQAAAKTSSWDGSHTADINAEFFDQNGNLLLSTSTQKEVIHLTYAHKESMQRAFLRAYQEIAGELRNHLATKKVFVYRVLNEAVHN